MAEKEGKAIAGVLYSMTGYGRGTAARDGVRVVAEVRSVNHRYLDVVVRLPGPFLFLEEAVRDAVKTRLRRGRVDVALTVDRPREGIPRVRYELLDAYVEAAREVQQRLDLPSALDLGWVMGIPDLVSLEEPDVDRGEMEQLAREAMDGALTELLHMRGREGEKLRQDMTGQWNRLVRLVEAMKQAAPAQVERAGERLRERIAQHMPADYEVDEQRLLQEIVILADRLDVEEEIHRLESHLRQLEDVLQNPPSPVGRRMDFLAQEIQRELNTIGAKAASVDVAEKVVEAKVELERLREQIQNIE